MRRHRAKLAGRSWRRAAGVVALAATAALGGCAGKRAAEPPAQSSGPKYGLEARLRSLDSAVTGKVRVIDQGDGVTVLVSAINLPTDRYRVVFHETPNCSSPNGFSVGRPWAPAATGRDPRELTSVLSTNQDGTAEASVHVRGLRTSGPDGVAGHSVVLYAGDRVTDAVPDVKNNRVACGTFEPSQPFQF